MTHERTEHGIIVREIVKSDQHEISVADEIRQCANFIDVVAEGKAVPLSHPVEERGSEIVGVNLDVVHETDTVTDLPSFLG